MSILSFLLLCVAILLGAAVLLFFLFFVYLLLPSVRGAPFVVSEDVDIETMIRLARVKPGARAVDLGSGDGRIVIAFARAGAQAHGYEINPFLVMRARRNIRNAGLEGRAFAHWKSFWGENLSSYDIVTLYGITYIMKGLEEKLGRELKSGARVLSNYFTFPGWVPKEKDGRICLYKIQ